MKLILGIVEPNPGTDDYEIAFDSEYIYFNIIKDDTLTIKEKLQAKDKILESIKEETEFIKGFQDKEYLKKYNKCASFIIKNLDNILSKTEAFRLCIDTDYREFIDNNPIVTSKKIILAECLEIGDEETLEKIKTNMAGLGDNIYIYMEENDNFQSLESCEKTNNLIRKTAEDILKLNLSPIERIMFTYDLVRKRIYKLENKNESSFKSRDLNEILNGEAIVCAGYAKYFDTLLKYMNYKCDLVKLKTKNKKGHMRNIVYIEDEKYAIDGVYYFDTTWDSQELEDDNSYLDNYSYFARTRNSLSNSNRGYTDESFPVYSKNIELYEEKLSQSPFELGLNKLNAIYTSINYMNKMITGERLISFNEYASKVSNNIPIITEEIIEALKEILPKFDKKIPSEKLVEILCNVRFVENQINPLWYPCEIKHIYRTTINSGWATDIPPEAKLLAAITGIKTNEATYFLKNNKKSLKELETKKLVYTLKNTLKKKEDENGLK